MSSKGKWIVTDSGERGYVLILVVSLLAILAVSSSQYWSNVTRNVSALAHSGNKTSSLMLAEAALNRAAGMFVFGSDLDGNNAEDNAQLSFIVPAAPGLFYAFYMTDGNVVSKQAPSLLQRVANGEAAGQAGNVAAQAINENVIALQVQDLFGAGYSPLLYVLNGDQLQISNNDWNTERSNAKAAAWIELVQDPVEADQLNLYVQAMAQVGLSKSYVQKYVGALRKQDSQIIGRTVAAISQG